MVPRLVQGTWIKIDILGITVLCGVVLYETEALASVVSDRACITEEFASKDVLRIELDAEEYWCHFDIQQLSDKKIKLKLLDYTAENCDDTDHRGK